ncbi:hypothetical protein JCM11641_001833 [Rhodosporidiobolus odoratus]
MAGRTTRASTRAAGKQDMPPPASLVKRPSAAPPATPPRKRQKTATTPTPPSPYVPPTPGTQQRIDDSAHQAEEEGQKQGAVLLQPALKFKYADAKAHMASIDPRWKTVMDQLMCKPFEDEDELKKPFNPFRSLVSSLLGQQISWLAARAIQHKFCRLFFPDLPEKLPPPDSTQPRTETPFPTPQQVLSLPDRTTALRGAGLSGRKVEYVLELAERFSDGRFSAEKLWGMEDEELYKTLVECRGIGPWTVHMFEIFSAKRQDVLPVGDLGIQKNLCRWFSQDPSLTPSIHPRKLAPASPTKLSSSSSAQVPPTPEKGAQKGENGAEVIALGADPKGDEAGEGVGVGKLAQLGAASVEADKVVDLDATGEAAAVKEEEDAEAKQQDDEEEREAVEEKEDSAAPFPETSNNLTPAILRTRLNGKKLKGNIYLTPQEMEELTAAWKPYRSVACWYLWSLSDGTGDP